MLGVERETVLAEKISTIGDVKILNFCGKTSISKLQWLLKRCIALICNDTGTMHLAAALSAPVIALFRPTNPVWFGPLGDKHQVIRGKAHCSPCSRIPYVI